MPVMQLGCVIFASRNRAHPVRGKGLSRLSQTLIRRLRTFTPAVRTRASNGGRRMPEQTSPSVHFNLEFLKKEAKALLKQCRSRDHKAIGRVRARLPYLAKLDDEHAASEIKLSDVQFALAREHGYANWANLKRSDRQPETTPDFSQPGSDGQLPEDYVPWRWGVSYTVRPELLSPLVCGEEYLITASVLRKRPDDETFTGYADLYERAIAIAHARAAALQCAQGGSLHTRLLNHTWFRHGSTHLVRAAVTLAVTGL